MGCETGFLPILNYGKWAGPGYAGGVCLAQAGRDVDAALLLVPGVDFMDAATKNHDINYTYIDQAFGKTGNPDFTLTPEYYRALLAADVEMLRNVLTYRPEPGDLFATAYRDVLIKAFYVKADWEYGLGREMATIWKEQLQSLDPSIAEPSVEGPRFILTTLGGYSQANTLLQLQDFQRLVTSNLSGQERMLFNAHLSSLNYLDNTPVEQADYTRRIVAPEFDEPSQKWTATVMIDGKAVFMELDRNTRVFTRRVVSNGVDTTETYTPTSEPGRDDFNLRGYDVVKTDGGGSVLDQYSVAKPPVPVLFESEGTRLRRMLIETNSVPSAPTPEDLQVDLSSPVSGEPYADSNIAALSPEGWQAVANVYAELAGDLGEISNVRVEYEGVAPVVVASVGGKDVRVALHDDNSGGGDDTGSRSLVLSYRDDSGQSVTTVIGYNAALDGQVGDLPLLGRPVEETLGVFPVENGGAQTLTNLLTSGTLLDALSLLRAIQTGEPLPILASGLRLANDISNLNNLASLELSGASNVASGVLSLLSLEQALQQGDSLAALTAGAQALSFGANAFASFAAEQTLMATTVEEAVATQLAYDAAQELATTLNNVLPALNIVNSLAHGDAVGAAVNILALNPATAPIAVAYNVFKLVTGLFDANDAPEPWGSGRYVWEGNGIGIAAAGEAGGLEAVNGVMNQTLAALNQLIAAAASQNSPSPLGVIPNRLAGVSYGTDGYHYTDLDPLTGVERHPELRFDTNGRPYNATPGSPEAFQNLTEALLRSALARGAIAPQWEVDTARAQTQAGDPQAGLTEEERAGRAGRLAAPLPEGATRQSWRPVALDLDGDGIETQDQIRANAVFDVDDSGFRKNTGWIGPDDAFLALDRNYNGQIDSSRELFSNGAVDLSARGLAGLAWVDANADGKLTQADPVFQELRLWRDANGDGVQAPDETQTLAEAGISELDYALGRYTRYGQVRQMASSDLRADAQGSRLAVVPEGILLESSGGQLSLFVTRVDDLSEAEEDGGSGGSGGQRLVRSLRAANDPHHCVAA